MRRMSTAASAPGVLGHGRFEVRGTLGEGGAGVVYRAFDHSLQREVALKLLRRASGRDLFRFKREFRALADIAHPNLVTLHELHAAGGDWYFTMELVEGVSFIDWVRPPFPGEVGPRSRGDIALAELDSDRLRAALVQLADALVALHEAGKLHRDLKPSNVLVTAAGRLALLDFGLVRALTDEGPERVAVGTPVYMSPEQAADRSLSPASDWYSVGAMLYEALCGQRPFEGEPEQVMRRKQTEVPVHPAQLAGGLPADLARLCLALLASDAPARPEGLAILRALGSAPSASTRRLGRSRSSPPASLVGRTRELEELTRALGDAGARGLAVMVRGRSGLGKSTLARAFLRGLGDRVTVLEGRCFEREAVPFKMLDGVVDMLTSALVEHTDAELEAVTPPDLGALVKLFPVLRRVARYADLAARTPAPPDPQEARRRAFDALCILFAALATRRPLAIFVDDAHWGDLDSAAFFAELVAVGAPGVLVIFAHRPEDYLGIVARLRRSPADGARHGEVRELEVGPLSDADARVLVAELSLAPEAARGDDAVAAILEAAGGNPLVLGELARASDLSPRDLARGTQTGTAPSASRDTPASIIRLVAARASKLSPDAQAMLAVSSVAARPLPVEIAAHAAGVVGGHDEAAALAAERLAGVRTIGGQTVLQPAHDFIRAAVVAQLDAEARAGWHEALARAFEDVQGPAELDAQAVVEHWLAAGHPANAAHHAVPAAHRAEDTLAFRRAAELYEIALLYGPWDAAGQRDLMRRQAYALACAGLLDEAATVYGRASELLIDDEAIDLERLCVEALLRRGRLDEALPVASRLLAQVGVRVPLEAGASRTRLATQWIQMKLRGLDYVERAAADVPPALLRKIDVLYSITSGLAFADPGLGRVLQTELLRAALDAGEPTRVALALAQELCYAAAPGSRNRAAIEAVAARLQTITARLPAPDVAGLADGAIGIAAYMSGRWKEARGHLERGIAALRDHGAGIRWELDIGEAYWVGALYYLGAWHELTRVHAQLLRDAIDRGDVVAQQNLRTGRAILAWLVLDRADEARLQLAAAEAVLAPGFQMPNVLATQAAASIELYRGDAAAAARRLADAWPLLDRAGALRLQHLRIELVSLRARVGLADPTRPVAERVKLARAAADELIKEGAAWAQGLGHLVRAAAAAFAGEAAGARGSLDAATAALGAADMIAWQHVAALRRAQLASDPAGAEAARAALAGLGAVDPAALAALLVPWPS